MQHRTQSWLVSRDGSNLWFQNLRYLLYDEEQGLFLTLHLVGIQQYLPQRQQGRVLLTWAFTAIGNDMLGTPVERIIPPVAESSNETCILKSCSFQFLEIEAVTSSIVWKTAFAFYQSLEPQESHYAHVTISPYPGLGVSNCCPCIFEMSSATTESTTSVATNSDHGGDNGGTSPTSSPLLFFVALGFGVVFTNLWYVQNPQYNGCHLLWGSTIRIWLVTKGLLLASNIAFDTISETASYETRRRASL